VDAAWEIHAIASLPRALGALGVGILNAADDLAGGGAAVAQGARQAARQPDDEWVRLYRAVSPEEVDDIVKSGMFRPTVGSLEGKWFTTTPELAARWGKRLWEMSQSLGNRPKPFTIIEAAIPKWLRRIERPRHDGIGPAIYIDYPELQHIRFVRELEAVPWIR